MISRQRIRRYCDAIAREFKRKKIVLLLSRACRKPTRVPAMDVSVILPPAHLQNCRPSLNICPRICVSFAVATIVLIALIALLPFRLLAEDNTYADTQRKPIHIAKLDRKTPIEFE